MQTEHNKNVQNNEQRKGFSLPQTSSNPPMPAVKPPKPETEGKK